MKTESTSTQQAAKSVAASEHYDEVRATLQGVHALCESISGMERRVGTLGSHARGFTHKITNALRHLDALAAKSAAPAAVTEAMLANALAEAQGKVFGAVKQLAYVIDKLGLRAPMPATQAPAAVGLTDELMRMVDAFAFGYSYKNKPGVRRDELRQAISDALSAPMPAGAAVGPTREQIAALALRLLGLDVDDIEVELRAVFSTPHAATTPTTGGEQ